MPESTSLQIQDRASLQIQDRASNQIRVVEIPWIAVRVGRAAYCEVRLPDGGLAEEVCRLHRRGRGWQLIPLGPAGSIRLGGEPVDGPRPLPFDVPFRVGSWSMTLRQSNPADPERDRGSALTSRDRPRLAPALTPRSPVAAPEPRSAERINERPTPPIVTLSCTLASELRSTERINERPVPPVVPEPPLKAAPLAEGPTVAPGPVAVNPWEARWRAAGERLQSIAKSPKRAAEPRSFRSPDRYQGVPLKVPTASPHQQEEPLASGSSRVPQEIPRAAVTPEAFPALMPPCSGFPEQPEPRDELTARIDGGPTARIEELPQPEVISNAAQTAEIVVPTAADESPSGAEITVELPESSAGEPDAQEQLRVADEPTTVEIDKPQAQSQSPVSRFVADTAWAATAGFPEFGSFHATLSTTTEALWQTELRPPDSPQETLSQSQSPNPSGGHSATLPDPSLPPEGQHLRRPERQTRPGDSRQRSRNKPEPTRPVANSHLPSAKEILAAVSRQASPLATEPSSAGWHQATPTISLEPGYWSAPLWLFWPPAVLLVLLLGSGDLILSWRWAGDAHATSVVARELLVPPVNPNRVKPLPEWAVPPEPSWWQTTPLHLTQWGVYLGRPGLEGNRTGEGRQLIDVATQIAPLNPLAQLARAQLSARLGDSAGLARHLGLSRDPASLAWSARALRLSGRKEAAIRVYRQALQLACRCDLRPTASLASSVGPAFDDDSRVRRYYLPGEATAREIARELLADTGWSLQEWSEAMPKHSVAALALARLLREQERPEAQKLLEQTLASGTEDLPRGTELAIHMAARAEAFAMLAQWREAQRQYQQAIDQIDDVTTRRCWWYNLASIALQLDDEAQRKAALQAALEISASDDISRRALELQRSSQSLVRLRPGVTKAN